MGICKSSLPKKNFSSEESNNDINLDNVYGIKKLGQGIFPKSKILNPLQFDLKIFNIKAKGLSKKKFYFGRLVIGRLKSVFLRLSEGPNPKFQNEELVTLNIMFEELEKTYIEIILYQLPENVDRSTISDYGILEKKYKELSRLKVDLLTIAIGPEHHDLRLLDNKNKNLIGRICFNIACHHKENVALDFKTIQIKLSKLIDKELAFKLRFKKDIHNIIDTDYTYSVKLNNNLKEEVSTCNWIEPQDGNKLLLTDMILSLNELRCANVHILIFDTIYIDVDGVGSNPDGLLNLKPKYTFAGSVRINFYQILTEKSDKLEKTSSQIFQQYSYLYPTEDKGIPFEVVDNINQRFSDKIMYEGNIIGDMEGVVHIKNVPLIKQILCGVHTEKGFSISSIFLSSYSIPSSNDTTPPEVTKLITNVNQILGNFNESQNLLRNNGLSNQDINIKNMDILKEIKSILEKSVKESCLIYNYTYNNSDILKAQEIMLSFGLTLLNIIESLNYEQRMICFEILILLNDRGEFDLSAMTFTQNDENLKQRVSVAEKYLNFLNKSLEFVLERFSLGKVNDKESKSFAEFFLSIAYFKIPMFRKAFLEVIRTGINEMEKVDLDEELDMNVKNNPINYLIDWEHLFYHKIKNLNTLNQELDDIEKETQNILLKCDWKERLSKRGQALFSIINKLERNIQNMIVLTRSITWNNIPGFKILIGTIKHELSVRNVSTYPSKLIDLLPMFINDHEIINSFFKLIVGRTNAYDTNAVFTLFKIIDSFFSEFEKKEDISVFNKYFDYSTLNSVSGVIFSIDHSLCVSKFLWLYYKNAHIMSIDHFEEFMNDIYKNRFYILFFHWSYQVRNVFYNILLYIIYNRIKFIKNVAENRRIKLMNGLDTKMEIIKLIKKIINERYLDSNFNNNFNVLRRNHENDLKEIPKIVENYVVISIQHYNSIEKTYEIWEKENKKKSYDQIIYPEITLQPPKDDIINYSDNW